MATLVEMPRLSDTMVEGTVAEWLKNLGDMVNPGDGLADIETDKAIMTFESFDEGVLLHIFVEPGGTVPLGTPIAALGEPGEDIAAVIAEWAPKVEAALAGDAPAEAAGGHAAPAAPATPAPASAPAPAPAPAVAPSAPVVTQSTGALNAPHDDDGRRIKASPLARRIAIDRGIDLRGVAGTGPGGRIIKRDVEGLEPGRQLRRSSAARTDEVVRVTQMRKTIARRLLASKQGAPHYYLTITINAGPLMALRKQINAAQERQKISYNDLVMKACAVALQDHPEVNVAWEGDTIRRFAGVHLGFAVALPEGLITPVVRDADQLPLVGMAQEIRRLAGLAKDMKLESADYTGNSFCVSNLGMYGIEEFTAIINPPAACILAVGGLRPDAVVVDGEVLAGHKMSMTLSLDHRAVDGATGAAFLKDLKMVLEQPLSMLLD